MIRLVAANFVPVALNTDRLPDSAGGRLFKELMKRWPQGLWVVTPDGKTLGHHYHTPKPGDNYAANQKRWVADTVAMLEASAKAAGPLPPRAARAGNPFPDRGVGVNKDGGVRLAVSVIGLRNGKPDGPPAVDSVVLAAKQWATVAPPGVAEFALPADVAKAFAPALAPVTDSIFVPRPADVTTAVVTASVVRMDAGRTVVRYRGKWESRHFRDNNPAVPVRASATGEGVAEVATDGKVLSLVWVLRGSYAVATATPNATAAVVEWVRE